MAKQTSHLLKRVAQTFGSLRGSPDGIEAAPRRFRSVSMASICTAKVWRSWCGLTLIANRSPPGAAPAGAREGDFREFGCTAGPTPKQPKAPPARWVPSTWQMMRLPRSWGVIASRGTVPPLWRTR